MSVTISQRELRNGSAQVMDRVEAGESFMITRNRVPVARIVPISDTREEFDPRFVRTAEIIEALSGLPRINYRTMRHEADEFFGDEELV
jgi:prevent-host-death family protein